MKCIFFVLVAAVLHLALASLTAKVKASALDLNSARAESLGNASSSRADIQLFARCITDFVGKAIKQVKPWKNAKTEFVAKRVAVAMPKKIATDSGGFISWVLQRGCAKQGGKEEFVKLWEKSGKKKWGKGNQKRITPAGFYRAFDRDKTVFRPKWFQSRKGDVLVSQYDKSARGCNGRGGGHAMILMGTPMRLGKSLKCLKYVRYIVKVADASRGMHWNGRDSPIEADTRAACKKTKFFDKSPGCGVGSGWIYAWGDSNKVMALSLRPPTGRPPADGPACPSATTKLQCHKYIIARPIK